MQPVEQAAKCADPQQFVRSRQHANIISLGATCWKKLVGKKARTCSLCLPCCYVVFVCRPRQGLQWLAAGAAGPACTEEGD
jgi:hypothetical protein